MCGRSRGHGQAAGDRGPKTKKGRTAGRMHHGGCGYGYGYGYCGTNVDGRGPLQAAVSRGWMASVCPPWPRRRGETSLRGHRLVFPAAAHPLQEPGVVAAVTVRPLPCRRLFCVLLLLLLRLPLLPGVGALDPPRPPPGTSPRRPVTWQGSLQATTRTIEHIRKWIGPAAAESPPHHISSSLSRPPIRREGEKSTHRCLYMLHAHAVAVALGPRLCSTGTT